MGRRPTDPKVVGSVLALLRAGYSEKMVIRELKKTNIEVTKGLIFRIKKKDKNVAENNENKAPKVNLLRVMNRQKLKKLKKMASDSNPPPQRHMAKVLGTSQSNISHHINKTLNLKLRRKSLVHVLSPKNIENRRRRSLALYKMLNKSKWKNVITTDEAWFYITNCNGKRRIQYVSRDQKHPALEAYNRRERNAKGLMVWAGVSFNGKTSLHFVNPGVKINSSYYINSVLKKFLARDARRLYPRGDFLFHQDSATWHTSKATIEWMTKNMKFISKDKWIPKSCDAAPMDYAIWGWLKRSLWGSKVRDMAGLKKALKRAWKRLPQELINKSLQAWPKRIYKIYKNKGKHIEL